MNSELIVVVALWVLVRYPARLAKLVIGKEKKAQIRNWAFAFGIALLGLGLTISLALNQHQYALLLMLVALTLLAAAYYTGINVWHRIRL